MPELTNSSVGSFAGTSELDGTIVCPFDRKNSRKLVRMSLDFIGAFYCSAAKNPERRGRPGDLPAAFRRASAPPLCVDAAVLQQPRPHRRHRALVRRRQFLQRATGVESGEQLAIFLLRPRLAGLRRQLRLAAL